MKVICPGILSFGIYCLVACREIFSRRRIQGNAFYFVTCENNVEGFYKVKFGKVHTFATELNLNDF